MPTNRRERAARVVFRLAPALLSALVALPRAGAQGVTPIDDREASRFAAVTRSVAAAAYSSPVVVAHGEGAAGWLFLVLATRGDSGALLAIAEPNPGAPARPVPLERDRTPANIGFRGMRAAAFLGAPDLFDIVVEHRPFQLEVSREYETHHIVRRSGASLALVCEFGGSDKSSYSKGMTSVVSTRTVTVERIAGASGLTFDVITTDERSERQNSDTSAVPGQRTTSHVRYELPALGQCKLH